MPLQDADQWHFFCLMEYVWIKFHMVVGNQEKGVLAVGWCFMITLAMASAQEYGVVS